MLNNLYLDSDGVLNDMEAHVAAHNNGITATQMADPDLWALVNSISDFWLTMPLMPDAHELYDGLKHLNPVVLTGCPRSGYHEAVDSKLEKFAMNFPQMMVLTCPSRYKPLAAAVHLGMVDLYYMDLARAVFLHELELDAEIEATAVVKETMDGINLDGAILVDDLVRNAKRWTQAGGRAIRHKSASQTLMDFQNEHFFTLRK